MEKYEAFGRELGGAHWSAGSGVELWCAKVGQISSLAYARPGAIL